MPAGAVVWLSTGSPVSTQVQIEIGAEFLGYRIEELIGRGGMGVVYRAYDLRLKRTVALKLIAPELALDERFHARFARETELVMSLEHPNVVPVYDAGDRRRPLLPGDASRRGNGPAGAPAREGALEPAARACDLPPDRERLGCGTRERSRPSGRQALQRSPRQDRARLSGRLRADPTSRRAGHARWRRPLGGNARLSRARADRGRDGRRPAGRLLARLPPLRVPHRRASVLARVAAGAGVGASGGGAAEREPAQPASPRRSIR